MTIKSKKNNSYFWRFNRIFLHDPIIEIVVRYAITICKKKFLKNGCIFHQVHTAVNIEPLFLSNYQSIFYQLLVRYCCCYIVEWSAVLFLITIYIEFVLLLNICICQLSNIERQKIRHFCRSWAIFCFYSVSNDICIHQFISGHEVMEYIFFTPTLFYQVFSLYQKNYLRFSLRSWVTPETSFLFIRWRSIVSSSAIK